MSCWWRRMAGKSGPDDPLPLPARAAERTEARGREARPDAVIWADYVRQVRPLSGRAVPEAAAEPPPPSSRRPRGHGGIGEKAAASSDRRRPARRRRRAGRCRCARPGTGCAPAGWCPSASLDLHGRTAQAAFHALTGFLQRAHADRVRCVEVITGRGDGPGGGVIRRELPVWLNLASLRPLVLGAVHPHPANPGAVRLLLRRQR